MNISALKSSRFLTKSDVNSNGRNGILLTIKGDPARGGECITEENLAMEGQTPEMGHVLNFHEIEKGMVLKTINAQLIAKIIGSEETAHWNGHKIVLYEDPTIIMAGRVVGGIRARAPRNMPVTGGAPITQFQALQPAAPAPRPYVPPAAPAPTPAQYADPAQPSNDVPF